MRWPLSFAGLVLALSAGFVSAQTADHAPTKPAADAAARYDRSLKDSAPANEGPDKTSKGDAPGSGSSASTNTSTTDSGEPAAKSSKTDTAK